MGGLGRKMQRQHDRVIIKEGGLGKRLAAIEADILRLAGEQARLMETITTMVDTVNRIAATAKIPGVHLRRVTKGGVELPTGVKSPEGEGAAGTNR